MQSLVTQVHLHAYILSALRACAWLFVVTTIFVPLEAVFAVHRGQVRKSLASDLGFFFISNFVPQLLLVVPLSIATWIAYYCVPANLHAGVARWPFWLRGLAAFVVADFGFYWGHRLSHMLPVLWRFHSIHHAPQHLYFLISARAHPIDNAVTRMCGLVPIYILGLGAPQSVQGTLIATLLMLAVTIWGFFIHANVRWRFGPLEWLIATPGFHHWHHTKDEHRDRNFGSMLPGWDWMFGTLYLPKHEWPTACGTDMILPSSLTAQIIHPFRTSQTSRSQISNPNFVE